MNTLQHGYEALSCGALLSAAPSASWGEALALLQTRPLVAPCGPCSQHFYLLAQGQEAQYCLVLAKAHPPFWHGELKCCAPLYEDQAVALPLQSASLSLPH